MKNNKIHFYFDLISKANPYTQNKFTPQKAYKHLEKVKKQFEADAEVTDKIHFEIKFLWLIRKQQIERMEAEYGNL